MEKIYSYRKNTVLHSFTAVVEWVWGILNSSGWEVLIAEIERNPNSKNLNFICTVEVFIGGLNSDEVWIFIVSFNRVISLNPHMWTWHSEDDALNFSGKTKQGRRRTLKYGVSLKPNEALKRHVTMELIHVIAAVLFFSHSSKRRSLPVVGMQIKR